MKIEFASNEPLALDYPPVPVKKVIPDWYKDMPMHLVEKEFIHDAKFMVEKEMRTTNTIKACMPVLDYLTSGYVIRAHAQILVTPSTQGTRHLDGSKFFWWKSAGTFVAQHGHGQCPIKIEGYEHTYFKFVNPWRIRVPPGYSCLFYQPYYFMENRYSLFPAIVDCDTFDDIVSFPGYIRSEESFFINPGDPVMVVFPFKRDEWEHSIVKMSDLEYKETVVNSKINHYLFEGYKKFFHKKKSYK